MNETFGTKLWHLGNGEFITRQNFEIVDFQKQCVDADGNLDDLVDVVAGGTHFVVLTSNLEFHSKMTPTLPIPPFAYAVIPKLI